MLVTSCSGVFSAAANSPPPSTIPTTNGCWVVPLTAIVLLPCVEMLPLTGAFHGSGKPTGRPVGASTGYAAAGNGNETCSMTPSSGLCRNTRAEIAREDVS